MMLQWQSWISVKYPCGFIFLAEYLFIQIIIASGSVHAVALPPRSASSCTTNTAVRSGSKAFVTVWICNVVWHLQSVLRLHCSIVANVVQTRPGTSSGNAAGSSQAWIDRCRRRCPRAFETVSIVLRKTIATPLVFFFFFLNSFVFSGLII